jgi:hypothetical protein
MAEPTREKQRDSFIGRHLDETTGLLMRAFAEARPLLSEQRDSMVGRAMISQMRAAKELLGRVFDDLVPKAEAKPGETPATIPLKRAAT